jgi:hypothetical protein
MTSERRQVKKSMAHACCSIGRVTHLGEGQAVLEVDVLALNVAGDGVRGGILGAGDLEGDVGGGEGLDLEGGALDGVVLEEEVGRGLAEILLVEREMRPGGGWRREKRKAMAWRRRVGRGVRGLDEVVGEKRTRDTADQLCSRMVCSTRREDEVVGLGDFVLSPSRRGERAGTC